MRTTAATRITTALLIAFALLSGRGIAQEKAAVTDGPMAVMPEKQTELFRTYCYSCHDADSADGGVNLEDLSLTVSHNIETAETWQKVLNAINSGEMPPSDETPIATEVKASFLEALSQQMVVARKILGDSGGVITLRRLNRREYQHTIESLLGISPNVSLLPDDQAATDFDTRGASLFMSSDQVEQYLHLARLSLKPAFDSVRSKKSKLIRRQPEHQARKIIKKRVEDFRDRVKRSRAFKAQSEKPVTDFGFIDPYDMTRQMGNTRQYQPHLEDYLKRPETKHGQLLFWTRKMQNQRINVATIPGEEPGKYILRVRVGCHPDVDERYRYLEFTHAKKRVGWRRITATVEDPQVVEIEFEHLAGLKQSCQISARSHQGRGDIALNRKAWDANGFGVPPSLWVDWVELEGPIQDDVLGTGSLASKGEKESDAESDALSKIAKVLGLPMESVEVTGATASSTKSDSDGSQVRSLLRDFAKQAFRGDEPDDEYLDHIAAIYADNRKLGQDVETALLDPLAVVLSSPSFLYLVETGAGENDTQLSAHELAARLSYFIWSEPPDRQLLRLARSGELHDADTLRQQTTRLLADPRSERFVRSFVHQWLDMTRLEMFQYDGLLYPEFDNATRESAREEIYETVRLILDERLPLSTLLKADFVMVNDVLAHFYDLPNVTGHDFRKVRLPPNSPRGGLLGSAAVAAMGSDGFRSSPVERGAWVMRHLLNSPPPPAPANVPQLSRLAGKVLPARAMQKMHMEEPQCSQCHRKIDPIGYGMQNFDAAGRWRDEEMVIIAGKKEFEYRVGPVKYFPIDAAGSLPNGAKFKNFFQLRDAVYDYKDSFAVGFTEHLIEYGLGRPYGFTDEELCQQMMEQADSADSTIADFIHALVQSKTFQSK